MSRTRAVLLAFLTGVLALGAFELWRTDATARTFALALGLFMGAVAMASATQLVRAKIPPIDADGSINIPSSPVRAILYALGMSASAVAAYLLAFDTPTQGHIAITVLLCVASGACAAIAIYYLFRTFIGEPVYRLDREGISSPSMRDWTLAWRDIRKIETFEIQYVERLYLQPTPEARHALNWLERVYGMGVMGVVIGPGTTGLALRDLERLVRDYWERYRG